jgi:hypothetical protein
MEEKINGSDLFSNLLSVTLTIWFVGIIHWFNLQSL